MLKTCRNASAALGWAGCGFSALIAIPMIAIRNSHMFFTGLFFCSCCCAHMFMYVARCFAFATPLKRIDENPRANGGDPEVAADTEGRVHGKPLPCLSLRRWLPEVSVAYSITEESLQPRIHAMEDQHDVEAEVILNQPAVAQVQVQAAVDIAGPSTMVPVAKGMSSSAINASHLRE